MSESARDIGVTRNSSSRSSSEKVKLFSVQRRKKSAIGESSQFFLSDLFVWIKLRITKTRDMYAFTFIYSGYNSSGMYDKNALVN